MDEMDFCNMTVLEELYLDGNKLTEETIPPEVFTCLQSLKILSVPALSKQSNYLGFYF
jgi:hypothetical protein